MRIAVFEFEGTVDELDSAVVRELLANRSNGAEAPVAAGDARRAVEDDEKANRGGVPGVAAEGQETVRAALARNPAGALMERFLAATLAWDAVRVHGIKRKGSPDGAALDYTRYLRLRKTGSQLGGFCYAFPETGVCNLRLAFGSDDELEAIAPDAFRLHTGHREYRTNIKITDESTLDQAIALARRAYDAT